MKLQVVAVTLCVFMLAAITSTEAAGCQILQLAPCLEASKNAKVMPSQQCCSNVRTMGQGASGAGCLCSLLSQPLAKRQGVVVPVALGIPQKCGIPVPKNYVCLGVRVPGG